MQSRGVELRVVEHLPAKQRRAITTEKPATEQAVLERLERDANPDITKEALNRLCDDDVVGNKADAVLEAEVEAIRVPSLRQQVLGFLGDVGVRVSLEPLEYSL